MSFVNLFVRLIVYVYVAEAYVYVWFISRDTIHIQFTNKYRYGLNSKDIIGIKR